MERSEKMKKVIAILVALLCLTGCGSSTITYTKIDYNELTTKLENKETFALVFAGTTCAHCQKYHDIIVNTKTDEKVEMFYIYTDELSDEDYAKLYSQFAVAATPTTVFFENGYEKTSYDRIVGAVDTFDLKDNLKKHGYIGG